MVGLVEGPVSTIVGTFPEAGLEVALLGGAPTHLGASAYLAVCHGLERGMPPAVDYARERALHDTVRQLVRSGTVRCAHDISDGGMAVALAELCMGGIGASLSLPGQDPTAALFGEDHGRVLVAYAPEHREQVGGEVLGTTGGSVLKIGPVQVEVSALIEAWRPTFEEWAQ
jgi:phosphoribosylformylglycinamidine synthase